MASIKLEIKGHEELKKKYLNRGILIGKATSRDLTEIGKMLKAYVTKQIKKQTGRPATRYNPTRSVNVSNPKAYPNDDLGGLIRGIRAFKKKKGKGKYQLQFQSKAPYALDLEFGTTKMAARPYMRPTLKANRKKIRAIIAAGVRRAL
jgi:HK97 gp10 family phage protein